MNLCKQNVTYSYVLRVPDHIYIDHITQSVACRTTAPETTTPITLAGQIPTKSKLPSFNLYLRPNSNLLRFVMKPLLHFIPRYSWFGASAHDPRLRRHRQRTVNKWVVTVCITGYIFEFNVSSIAHNNSGF